MFPIYVGVAGWSLPKDYLDLFPTEGSHLQRYASVYNACEINSSFYQEHRPKSYARWAASVPDNFRFSVKLSKHFTHESELQSSAKNIGESLSGIMQLGDKLGALLIQLPPMLPFEEDISRDFFSVIREFYQGPVAFEPRNITWASREAIQVLNDFEISKVIADPERCPLAQEVGDIIYYRLHGSPRTYYSRYKRSSLQDLADEILLKAQKRPVWCTFDNTARRAATINAIELRNFLRVAASEYVESQYDQPNADPTRYR